MGGKKKQPLRNFDEKIMEFVIFNSILNKVLLSFLFTYLL